MPPSLAAPVAALAARSAEASGQTAARTVLGLADLIIQSARNVRVNANTAQAISRRVDEMAHSIASELEASTADWEHSEALQKFEESVQRTLSVDDQFSLSTVRNLTEVQVALETQAKRSYLSQLLLHERAKGDLDAIAEQIDYSYRILMLEMSMQASELIDQIPPPVNSLAAVEIVRAMHGAAASAAASEAPEPATRIPPQPQIHFGRFAETQTVVASVLGPLPGRVAILGGPGMGKTTLAVAVLYDPAVVARFGFRRFFVPCEAAQGECRCLVAVAGALGFVASSPAVARQKLQSFSEGGPAIVVLDNLESVWEEPERRQDAEAALSFLDSLSNLSLIVTLRGAERPDGVRWSRPILPPLTPLSDVDARQTFLTIADTPDSDSAVAELLELTGNIPLAVVLMANLAQSESPDSLLRRWEELHTAMITRGAGQDRLSNLDVSIRLSLESPRMRALPAATYLLRILALLPHGVVDSDLGLWSVEQPSRAVSTLLRTALATRGMDERIHVLAPIRSFMLTHHPLSEAEAAPIYDHFFGLARLARESASFSANEDMFSSVAPELGNIEAVVRHALANSEAARGSAVGAVACLCNLFTDTGMGSGAELLPVALAIAEKEKRDVLRADLLLQWGRMAYNTFAEGDPQSLYGQARELYERAGHTDGIIDSRVFLASFLPAKAAIEETRALFALAQSRQDKRRMARCAQHLGLALERDGQLREAIAQHELAAEALEGLATAAGHTDRLLGYSKYLIAELHRSLGNLSRAVALYEEALPIWAATRYPLGVSMLLMQLGDTLLFQGRPLQAAEYAERGVEMHRALGVHDARSDARALLLLANAHIAAGNLDAALKALARVDALDAPGGMTQMVLCSVLLARADLAAACGDYAEARALLGGARAAARSRDRVASPEDMLGMEAIVIEALAEVECADGNPDEAAVLAITAAVIHRATDSATGPPPCLVLLADVVEADFAELLLRATMLPLQRMGHARGLAVALVRSATIVQDRGQRQLARHRALRALKSFGDLVERRVQVARAIADA